MRHNKLYIIIVATVFMAYTVVFATFERSTYSELEKRELAKFPAFDTQKLFDGSYTKEISAWFSDSEPFRDDFMTQSMYVKQALKLNLSDDDVVIYAPSTQMADADEGETADSLALDADTAKQTAPILDGNAQIAKNGIIVAGKGENVRAFMAYGGGPKSGGGFARAVNKYKETFGDAVNVYCMAIPLAIEYYCPEKAKRITKPQRPTIDNVHSLVLPTVKTVDVHAALSKHVAEDIYLRTDHHWAPLGGYYAAQEFARVAGVPFKSLDSYTRHVVHRFVGSMYGYSNDISVKNAPEDFVYYTPNGVSYTTTYVPYGVNENYQVSSIGKPRTGPYFHSYKDGSGAAYCTFMGGDMKLTQIRTSTKNGRRLIILKDSYGNTIPGYLFFSFEEIHVVDFRYFTYNMKEYVKENKITDILFANNVFVVCSGSIAQRYGRFLTQPGGVLAPPPPEKTDSLAVAATDSTAVKTTDSTAVKSVKKDSVTAKANGESVKKDSVAAKADSTLIMNN